MSEHTSPFAYGASFEPGEAAAGVRLGRLEAQYEELFSEVIDDGVITPSERAQLTRAAEALGLDRERLLQIERALTAAYEARRRVRVREIAATSAGPVSEDVITSAPPIAIHEGPPDARVAELARTVARLEARVAELEAELEDLRAQVAVEVDLSGAVTGAGAAEDLVDPDEIVRRLRPDPRDAGLLRALRRAATGAGQADRAFCVAHALVYLGAADEESQQIHARHKPEGLVRPRAALSRESWHRLLAHPEQEPLVGEIFAAVLGPVLLGRIGALRRDGLLPRLDPSSRQDAATSTVSAVRCFGWAANILGVQLPPLFADASTDDTAKMIPGTQPALRIGRLALSGRSPAELAFLAGEHLAYFRDDAFMRALFDGIEELEDVFLAALAIGNPAIPLTASVRARVAPLSQAIEPLLDPVHVDRLRGAFLRFVEEGGRTNLQRWATAIDGTAARAGMLLADDLAAAEAVLALEDPARLEERMNDLLRFVVGERYGHLRRQLGIAVE